MIFFVMYKNASSSILRAASSRSFRSSSLTPSSSSAASPCSLLGQRSFATSSPAFRSLPRWSHCLHSRPSPFGLTSQIRTASPVLDRLQRNFSSMGNISLSLSGSTFLDLCLFIYYYLSQRQSILLRESSRLFLSLVVESSESSTACLLSMIQGLVILNLYQPTI